MYQFVLLVLDDPDHVPAVMQAWEAAGVSGVTIVESTGLGRLRQAGLRDDVPLLPSLGALLRRDEERHRTLFTVVDDESLVDKLIAATESVTGDLNAPDSGVLFVLPVLRAVGIQGAKDRAEQRSAAKS